MPTLLVPLGPRPRVGMAWRSVHHSPEGFRVEGFWGLHLYRYQAEVRLDGRRLEVRPGWAGFTPPGALMDYRFAGRSEHLFFHAAFEGPSEAAVPAVFDAGTAFGSLWDRLQDVVAWRLSDPLRTEVRAWDLWLEAVRLAGHGSGEPPDDPVRLALRHLELHPDEPLRPADLADAASVSRAHLNRLFVRQLGKTVGAVIAERRLERALHLLRATDLPIKEVAVMVGVPDLQRFNKLVRAGSGRPPRAWR